MGSIAGFQCHAIQIDQNKNQNRPIESVRGGHVGGVNNKNIFA